MRGFRALVAVAVLAAPLVVADDALADCGLDPTAGRETITVAGRTVLVYAPPSLAEAGPPQVPLLVSFHGAGADGATQANFTSWDATAADERFVVAYPNGNFRTWNNSASSSDIGFAREVVAAISVRWCIDPDRVHADGASNGGIFAQRLACSASDVFASVTGLVASSADFFGGCAPPRPVAVALFHGDRDLLINPVFAARARDFWVGFDGCDTTPTNIEPPSPGGIYQHFAPCDGGVEVWWRQYPNTGHIPMAPWIADFRAIAWEFFERFPMP